MAVNLTPNDTVLFFRRTSLRGRWGIVGSFQAALAKALTECGLQSIETDGVFGKETLKGLQRLGTCERFASFEIGKAGANDGRVTIGLWQALVGPVLPTVDERAFAIWLTHEATDFDSVEFNFAPDGTPQPNDLSSYITWGPYGATAGHGGEVQHILSDSRVNDAVDECMGAESASVRELAAAGQPKHDAQARSIVQAAAQPPRREAWIQGFKCLGSKPQVRAAYQDFAFRTDLWLAPGTKALYSLLPQGQGTEVDYAFFVDVVMHMSIGKSRIQAAAEAVADRGGEGLSPAQRRQIIGQTLVSTLSNQIEDRRGRNVVFYVDGVADDQLSEDEKTAWESRSGLHASDFGLTDNPFTPDLLRFAGPDSRVG